MRADTYAARKPSLTLDGLVSDLAIGCVRVSGRYPWRVILPYPAMKGRSIFFAKAVIDPLRLSGSGHWIGGNNLTLVSCVISPDFPAARIASVRLLIIIV